MFAAEIETGGPEGLRFRRDLNGNDVDYSPRNDDNKDSSLLDYICFMRSERHHSKWKIECV
jgi:hypothetical protein